MKLQFLSKTKLTACVFLAVVIFQVVHLVQGTSADQPEKCITKCYFGNSTSSQCILCKFIMKENQ